MHGTALQLVFHAVTQGHIGTLHKMRGLRLPDTGGAFCLQQFRFICAAAQRLHCGIRHTPQLAPLMKLVGADRET